MEAVLVNAADVKNWSKANLQATSCTSKFKLYRCREGTEGDYKCGSTHLHSWCRKGVGGVATTGVPYSRDRRSTPTVQKAVWTSGSVWAGTKNITPTGV